jgi:hypothetical protein
MIDVVHELGNRPLLFFGVAFEIAPFVSLLKHRMGENRGWQMDGNQQEALLTGRKMCMLGNDLRRVNGTNGIRGNNRVLLGLTTRDGLSREKSKFYDEVMDPMML